MCAEQIPADAVFCPYCGTRFGEEAQDTPPPAALSMVVSPPAASANIQPASPASTPAKKSRVGLWIAGVLVMVIILGAIGTIPWTQRSKFPAISALIATTTPTATITPPPTLTPTITPTRTPRPTATATPLPTWVTDFAQPILDAIASRTPNVQEDFDNNSGGFRIDGWCDGLVKYLDGEMLLTGCPARHPNIDYADFVVEFDARFYPDVPSDSKWSLYFREQGNANPHNDLEISYNGDVSIHFHNDETSYDFPLAANPGNQSNHILVIGKGSRIAIYLNHQPLFYYPNCIFRYGNFQFWVYIKLAVDNFRIWNINDISVP
jgi:hypothetical protein